MPAIVQEIGSYAGLAAVAGLAVLSVLYFSQARDVKRLREWAGRAPERAADPGTPPTVVPGRVQAQPQTAQPGQAARPGQAAKPAQPGEAAKPAQAGKPGQPGQQPQPAAKPGVPAVAAAAGAGAATATQAKPAEAGGNAGGAAPAAPASPGAKPGDAAKPGTEEPSKSGSEEPAKSGAEEGGAKTPDTPATAAAANAAAPATPGTKPDGSDGADGSDTKSQEAAATAPAADTASTSAAKAGAPAVPGGPGGPATPAGGRPAGAPPVPPARTGQRAPVRPVLPPRPMPQQTAIIPPHRHDPWYRRLLANPRYLVLVIAGLLVLGGAGVFLVDQISSSDSGTPASNRATGNGTGGDTNQGADTGASTGNNKSAVVPGKVTVAVLNGTTVPGLAKQVGDQVESHGFRLGTVANTADQEQQRAESVVLFAPGHVREARAVNKRLGIGQREPIDAASQELAGDATVVVIAGADLSQ